MSENVVSDIGASAGSVSTPIPDAISASVSVPDWVEFIAVINNTILMLLIMTLIFLMGKGLALLMKTVLTNRRIRLLEREKSSVELRNQKMLRELRLYQEQMSNASK